MARSRMAFGTLPDSVVEYIFSLTPRSEGDERLGRHALPFVCRDFNRLYRSSKLLWRTMEVLVDPNASDEEVAGLFHSLRYKGAAVTDLFARLDSDKVALPDLMAHFSAEGLRDLELDLSMGSGISLQAGQLSCLGRFIRLQRLDICTNYDYNLLCPTTPPLQDNLTWLCALAGLQELSFTAKLPAQMACASISRLTALSSLRLSIFPADAQLSGMLTCLSQLQKLESMFRAAHQQHLGAACFSHLQQLSRLKILHMPGELEQPGGLQLGGLSTMPRLQQLSLSFDFGLDLQDLLRCSQLRHLSLWGVMPDPFEALEGGRLPQGSLPALTSLEWHPDPEYLAEFAGEEADVRFPEELCQLTQLQELRIKLELGIHGQNNIPALVSLPATFSQLMELHRLEISCLGLRELPAAITGLSKLKCLDLSRNLLSSESFPPGPYLANLCFLNLHGNRLQRIPETLAGATKLKALDISENLYYLQFSADQLGLLPSLRRLYITKRLIYCSPPSPGEFDPATPLWSTDTLEAALQVQRRFPSVAIITGKYMGHEEWWQQAWTR